MFLIVSGTNNDMNNAPCNPGDTNLDIDIDEKIMITILDTTLLWVWGCL